MPNVLRKCQAVPDFQSGIVVGIDVSKGRMSFGGFHPSKRTGVSVVNQNAEGFAILERFVDDLVAQGHQPWIAYEPTGPYSTCLREWLMASGKRLVQVNPYHVKRIKEVRDNSPEKDDWKDPSVIADLVWQGCYQEVMSLDGTYADLRAASAEWASLAKKRTALRNEFQALLQVWFPELCGIFKDAVCKSVCGIVRRYASSEALASARRTSLESTLRKASCGRTLNRVDAIWSAAKSSVAPAAGQQARHSAMLGLLDMLELVESRRERLKAEMEEFLSVLSEARCLLSLPRIGTITVAGLLGECGNIGQYRRYEQLEKFLGLNLYEVSSGKHRGRRRISKRGRALARYLICSVAMLQTRSGGLFEEYAKELKSRGKKTGEIRVAVARKLLPLMYAVARDQREFDPRQFFTGARTGDGLVIQQGTQAQAA
ncbi:MAG: IS110 family transposase [Actinomycetota bacterium]|nr:IS110 family transposase [Actinomycetota bacterium]